MIQFLFASMGESDNQSRTAKGLLRMIAAIASNPVTIPIIDLAPFSVGDQLGQAETADRIYQACHEIGFMYLMNVGIASELVDCAFQQSQKLFALPLADKQALSYPDKFSNRGYAGIERERLDPSRPGDLKETFNIGLDRIGLAIGLDIGLDRVESQDSSNAALTRNLWIPGDEEFRTTLLTFFAACTEAADRIFRAFALALDLPESFLVDRHRQQEHTLRLLHYPPLQQQPKLGQIRAGEHSDYGSITLLFQDDIGGLEVKTTDGDWIGAPQIPGTVLVNTGNLMQRWSNDVFCSTCHRVGLPEGDRAFNSRYAIAFFCQPDHDAEIVCIDRCQGANNPAKYPPILAGDYLISLLQATY